MRSIIIDLFGSYTPITYTLESGESIIPSGLSGVDFEWLSGVFLFALTFYCIMRLFGVLIKND